MKNGIIRFLTVVFCMVILTAPFSVYAEEQYTLCLDYSKENIKFSDLDIAIYRIADRNYDILPPYESYPVQLKGITSQTEWLKTAQTLNSYIQADRIEPYMTAKTDEQGNVLFKDIDEGLYLISGVVAEKEGRTFNFYDFMILVAEDISAKPKSEIHEPFDGEKVYTILKLWKDDSSKQRPPYISVDILKDAELYETVTLDSENDWSYTFNTDSAGKWTVVERDVPEGYFVVITEKETSFIITNTLYNTNPDDGTPGKNTGTDTGTPGGSKPVTPGTNAPQTGDTFPMKRYMIMLCVSGMMLVVLGFGMRRKDDAKGR